MIYEELCNVQGYGESALPRSGDLMVLEKGGPTYKVIDVVHLYTLFDNKGSNFRYLWAIDIHVEKIPY